MQVSWSQNLESNQKMVSSGTDSLPRRSRPKRWAWFHMQVHVAQSAVSGCVFINYVCPGLPKTWESRVLLGNSDSVEGHQRIGCFPPGLVMPVWLCDLLNPPPANWYIANSKWCKVLYNIWSGFLPNLNSTLSSSTRECGLLGESYFHL